MRTYLAHFTVTDKSEKARPAISVPRLPLGQLQKHAPSSAAPSQKASVTASPATPAPPALVSAAETPTAAAVRSPARAGTVAGARLPAVAELSPRFGRPNVVEQPAAAPSVGSPSSLLQELRSAVPALARTPSAGKPMPSPRSISASRKQLPPTPRRPAATTPTSTVSSPPVRPAGASPPRGGTPRGTAGQLVHAHFAATESGHATAAASPRTVPQQQQQQQQPVSARRGSVGAAPATTPRQHAVATPRTAQGTVTPRSMDTSRWGPPYLAADSPFSMTTVARVKLELGMLPYRSSCVSD